MATAAIRGLSGKIPVGKENMASYGLGQNLNQGDRSA